VVVDERVLAEKLIHLIDHVDLRREMGARARQHAERTFAWPKIISAYEDLWNRQLARRDAAGSLVELPAPLLSVPDRQRCFSHYPSKLLTNEKLRTSRRGANFLGRRCLDAVIPAAMKVQLEAAILWRALEQATEALPFRELVDGVTPSDSGVEQVRYHVLWLAKHGYLDILD
jgi:hypothetical protein